MGAQRRQPVRDRPWVRSCLLLAAAILVVPGCSASSDTAEPSLDEAVPTATPIPRAADAPAVMTEGFGGSGALLGAETDMAWDVRTGDWRIGTGTARLESSVDETQPATAVVDLGSGDGLVQVTLAISQDFAGLTFRYANPLNHWALVAAPSFGTWNLVRVVRGESETIANLGPVPATDGTIIGVVLDGPSISVTVNGAIRLSTIDATHADNTRAGLWAGRTVPLARWDDFLAVAAEERPPASPQATPSASPTPVASVRPIVIPTPTARPAPERRSARRQPRPRRGRRQRWSERGCRRRRRGRLSASPSTAGTIRSEHRAIDTGSVAMAAAVASTALGGLLFWFIAARRLDSETVGAALALFQGLLFIHYLTQLGLPMVISHFAPGDAATAGWVFRWSLGLRNLVTPVLTLAVLLAMWRANIFEPLHGDGSFLAITIFVLLAIGAGSGTLADARLVTLRAWPSLIARAAVPAVVRLPVVFLVPASTSGLVLFVIAAGPISIAGAIAAIALRFGPDRPTATPPTVGRSTITRYAGANAISMLLTDAPIFAAPVIVSAFVASDETAPFLVSWSIATMAFVLPGMLGQVLVSESARSEDIRVTARRAYLLSQILTCAVTLAAWSAAGLVARLYGPDYSAITSLLPVLVGANIAWVVTTVSLSVARARAHSGHIIGLGLVFAVATLMPTMILVPAFGTIGAAWAWFAGNCLTALVALWLERSVWSNRAADNLRAAAR